MSFAALCMMADSKGWVVVIAANHAGANIRATDEDAYMRTLAIYENKAQWRTMEDPIVSIRLDEPSITLDEAATSIATALHVTGVW